MLAYLDFEQLSKIYCTYFWETLQRLELLVPFQGKFSWLARKFLEQQSLTHLKEEVCRVIN